MRFLMIAAVAAAAGSLALATPPASAQKFPPYVKNCKKDKQQFERTHEQYTVPVVGGGVGKVLVVSQNYVCENKQDRMFDSVPLYGMKNASGKLVVPYAYDRVLPLSTTGALVGPYGPNHYSGSGGYRVFLAGKGEGKDLFRFDAHMLLPNDGCPEAPGEGSLGSVSSVIGVDVFNRGGKAQVTLFTPEGKARVMNDLGGRGVKSPVRRVGDVMLVHWLDGQNVQRSGILDLYGRQIAPVLSSAAVWATPADPQSNKVDRCGGGSYDLFIEGPSLDFNPANRFFGPLLIPVGRDGQPVALPKGAMGLFPVYWRKNDTGYSDSPPDMTSIWAVVFPKGQGFEFTLHVGSPSEALVASETAARYDSLVRSGDFGGLIAAKDVSDGKWTTYRATTKFVIGASDTDLDRSFNGAKAILEEQAAQRRQDVAASLAQWEAERAEVHKRNWETARSTGRLCHVRPDLTNTRQDYDDYLAKCGPDNFSGFRQLALAKGMTEAEFTTAANAYANAQFRSQLEVAKARATWEEEQRVVRQRNANQDPGASYYPGQWESAIRNAGNAATDAINQSSDNWLEQRRDQYIADWQRSQRAY